MKDCEFKGAVVRHTFTCTATTWATQRGVDPWDASGYFGLGLDTLIRVYSHHHPDHLRDAAEKMGKARK